MRTPRLRIVVTLLLLVICPFSAALDIPEFTPNVVDPSGVLDEASLHRVNAELENIRQSRHIWAAVFIVDSLGQESIEDVALQAFDTWQLGKQGVDNGLLLVLAMGDRRSRFEVGYGLEGLITDVAARHALDDYLAPKMREGDIAEAIVDAFDFLSQVAAQDPDALNELERTDTEEEFNWPLGLTAWGVLLLAIWLAIPVRNRWVDRQRARLKKLEPGLALDLDGITGAASSPQPWKTNVLVQCFLSINPGIFVVILSALFIEAFFISIATTLLVAFLIAYGSGHRYGSPQRYRRYLDRLERRRSRMIKAGYLEETDPGVYSYTASYYASRASSSSSSSSGSSYSSSSGGGRSGGGGASSGW